MREKTNSSEPLWVLFLWELLVLILFLVSKMPTAGDTLILISHITIYHTVSLERHPGKLWCWKFNFLMCLCLSMVEGPCTYSLFWWIDITSNDDCYWGKLGYDYIICSYIFIAQVFLIIIYQRIDVRCLWELDAYLPSTGQEEDWRVGRRIGGSFLGRAICSFSIWWMEHVFG